MDEKEQLKRQNYFDFKRDEFMAMNEYLQSSISEIDLQKMNQGGMMTMENMTMPLGYQEGTRDGNLVGDKEAMIKAFNLAKANNPDERFSDKDFQYAQRQISGLTSDSAGMATIDDLIAKKESRFSNTDRKLAEDQMTGDPQEEQIKASEDKAAIMSKRNEIIGVLNKRVEELSLSPEKAAEIINSITRGETPDLGLINQLHDDIVIQDQEFKKFIEQEKMAREQETPAMNRGGVMDINSLTRRI